MLERRYSQLDDGRASGSKRREKNMAEPHQMDRAARIVAGEEQDMTDRKMLELAAKAAGEWPGPEPFEHVLSRWNPLTDDGDALRLAVKLGLTIDTADGTPDGDIDTPATRVDSGNGRMLLIEVHGTDPYSATRRAIVRAAAAIGKEMT